MQKKKKKKILLNFREKRLKTPAHVMISNSSVDSTFSPLLAAPPRRVPVFTRPRLLSLGCVLLLLVALVPAYLYKIGAFSHVSRDVRIVNGTVREPNTGHVFRVNLDVGLDSEFRPLRLVGVFLKTKHVPEIEATLRVFTLGVYVDRQQARRVLGRYKEGPPSVKSKEEFARFVKVMSGGQVGVMAEYRLVMTVPGTQMLDHWIADLIAIWRAKLLEDKHVEALKNAFEGWFKDRGFHNHDVVKLEFSSRNLATYGLANKEKLTTCPDPEMGYAFVQHEFRENGDLFVDLLPTLWNEEYDDEF